MQTLADAVRSILRDEVPAFETAVVSSVDAYGRVSLRRLTSVTADPRTYSTLASYTLPRVGDTVVCARISNNLIVLGPVVGINIAQDTAVNMALLAAAVNLNGKYAGKQMWATDTLKPYWATGSAANSTWKDGAGGVITPV